MRAEPLTPDEQILLSFVKRLDEGDRRKLRRALIRIINGSGRAKRLLWLLGNSQISVHAFLNLAGR